MNASLRKDADQIVRECISAVLPDEAVRRTLKDYRPGAGKTLLVAAGKAAWQMAKAAVDTLGQVDGALSSPNMVMSLAKSRVLSAMRPGTPYRMRTALPLQKRHWSWWKIEVPETR